MKVFLKLMLNIYPAAESPALFWGLPLMGCLPGGIQKVQASFWIKYFTRSSGQNGFSSRNFKKSFLHFETLLLHF